jgi:hypothetical protein
MAPKETDSKRLKASEEDYPKAWMKGNSCYTASSGEIDL